MRTPSVCRCLLCQLEAHLERQFEEEHTQENFFQIARSGSILSGFPTVLALTEHLRSCRSNGNGTHPADSLLLEILYRHQADRSTTLLRDILLLAFIPVLHTACRQLAHRYPLLPAEDTLQQLLISFFETLNSPKLLARDSHLAFAISRAVKRETFVWADRQSRTPGDAERDEASPDSPASGIPELLERAVLLRHFLSRCQREGLLTAADADLLIHIKLEGHLGEKNGEYSNALRQRVKRLLRKLRVVAQTAGTQSQTKNS